MPAASILIKPSSSNCNMDCKYCFYKCLSTNREEYSKGFMKEDTLEQLVKNAIDYADGYLAFAFQGGEPTLAGIDFFQKAVDLQKKYNHKNLVIENTIQTNGLLMNEAWAEFLARNDFLVGISLDGPKKLHDANRIDTNGKPTFYRVMDVLSLFHRFHVNYNILTVVTNETTQKASSLYHFYKRNHFPFVQLIPCMDEANRGREKKQNPQAVIPEQYGKFLCEIFDLWYEDFIHGEKMDIRMFSNLAQMSAGYPAEECGMNGCCNCYFVVEGDGSIYPCDFYCMDQWKLGSLETSFQELLTSDKARHFLSRGNHTPENCLHCPHFPLCRGGCRRWMERNHSDGLELSYLCPAYKIFFDHCSERIKKLACYINTNQPVY